MTQQTRPSPTFIGVDEFDESTLSGLYSKNPTQYLRITKFSIQRFFEECLKEDGQFRSFFDKIATYTIGLNINEALSDDLDRRHLQIARYFSNVRERPPQIFIQDNGYEYTPSGLGGFASGWNMRDAKGNQVVRVLDVVPIPIEIVCAALSEHEIEDLAAFMSAALGEFQEFTINYIIKPISNDRGLYWEVRLPLRHSISAKSHSPVHGDPQMQIWQFSCAIEVEFENSTYLQYQAAPLAAAKRGSLALSIPPQVKLGMDTPISLQRHPKRISVYSNKPRVAVVRQIGTGYILRPKRLGTCKIIVSSIMSGERGPVTLASTDVTIVAR